MKKTRRTSKVGETVRDALVEIFRHDLKDVQVGLSSITAVDVSPDLHFARVYISGYKEDETRDVVKQLQNARHAVRKFLAKRIRLRYTPELDFKYDEAPERGGRIEFILDEIRKKDAKLAAERGESPADTNDDDSDDDES
jgi:ribosome-binding factor A